VVSERPRVACSGLVISLSGMFEAAAGDDHASKTIVATNYWVCSALRLQPKA